MAAGADFNGSTLASSSGWTAGTGYYVISAVSAGVTLSNSHPAQNNICQGTNEATNPACNINQDLYFNNVPLVHEFAASDCTAADAPIDLCTGAGTCPTCPFSGFASAGGAPQGGTLTTGQWLADYTNGFIYLFDNPSGNTVELGTDAQFLQTAASGITINGGIYEKNATPINSAVLEPNTSIATNWTIENTEIRLNHAEGIKDNGSNGGHIYTNNNVHDNGQTGIGCGGNGAGSGVTITNNTIANNGYAATSTTPGERGGIKCSAEPNATITGNTIVNNDGPGMWTDEAASNVLVQNNIIKQSVMEAIRFELTFSSKALSNTLINNSSQRVAGYGLSFTATGSCTASMSDAEAYSAWDILFQNNSITTLCGPMQIDQDSRTLDFNDRFIGNAITYCGAGALPTGGRIGAVWNLNNWAASHSYTGTGACTSGLCFPAVVDSNGNIEEAVVQGTSGSGPHPTWPTTGPASPWPGHGVQTSGDGGVTWQLAAYGSGPTKDNVFNQNAYYFAVNQNSNNNFQFSAANTAIALAAWQATGNDVILRNVNNGSTCAPSSSGVF